MSKTIIDKFLLTIDEQNDKRVFLSSEDIDIFPCSRRGQYSSNPVRVYDPEARLNTERTNRLKTAINGFTDSFVDSFDFENNTLTFVLAGYNIVARNINLDFLANNLLSSNKGTIYAHLSLHDNVSLMVEGYFTEILYRQSTEDNDINSLDVNTVVDTGGSNGISGNFFVGISFTNNPDCKDILTGSNRELIYHNLPIFNMTKNGATWQSELVQTSLLPKIEHGETENSIKISGNLTVTSGDVQIASTNGEAKTPQLRVNKITSDNTEIIVDKTLKVDTINSDSTKGLTVKRKLTAEKDIVVTAGNEVNTPQLRVDRITSSNTDNTITIDNKKLVVNRSLEMIAKADASSPAKATIEQAVIGTLEVKTDPTLKDSTGKITTLNFQATNNATIYDLDVGTNIDTSTLNASTDITTPKLKTNSITSNNNEITIDKGLKVEKTLAIEGATTVNQYINVGSPAIPSTTVGDVVAKNSIYAENNIVAKNTLKSPAIYQTVSNKDKPVPFIDIVEQADGQWQLQISRVSKIEN